MSDDIVLVERTGTCACLTLSRPQRGNALSASLVEALHDAFDSSLAGGARLIVFRGLGRHMCTGFDLDGLDGQSDGDLLLRFVRIEQLLQKIASAPVLTLAAGQGCTTGAGADLFAACDIRIAAPGATFAFPGIGFGLVLGSRRLAGRIGAGPARRLILEGRTVSASEAAMLGLATDIATEADLHPVLKAAAERATGLDPEALALVRRATAPQLDDDDLAALVRSASRPGLKERIAAHRERARTAREQRVMEPET